MAEDLIVFAADVDKKTAKEFDKIAEDNFRSRAQHMKYLIDKEIEFHRERAKGQDGK